MKTDWWKGLTWRDRYIYLISYKQEQDRIRRAEMLKAKTCNKCKRFWSVEDDFCKVCGAYHGEQ